MIIRPTPKAPQSTIRAASALPSVLPGHPGKAMHVFLLLMLFLICRPSWPLRSMP